MATYCYSNEGRELTVEKQFPIGKAPLTIKVAGVPFERDIAAEHDGFQDTPGNYPCYSAAMGVLPSQRDEFRKLDKAHGIETVFDEKGRVRLESREHRRRLMKARRVVDFDGYG